MTNINCAYRTLIDDSTVSCSNEHDLIHSGYVPARVCNSCPYKMPLSADFFGATQKLLVRKSATGEYAPVAKPCGGCGSTVHRHPEQDFDLQFVWPYWHGGAKGDEIRFSVRSVETFFQGRAKCTVIGDKPPWFTGHYIKQRKLKNRSGFRDMLAKVRTMSTHRDIAEEFVWMMDDDYFLRPFTVEEVAVPRAERFRRSNANEWQRIKTASVDRLTENGLPSNDFATHAPHYVEKQKLLDICTAYNLKHKLFTWEILYGNTYHPHPQRCRPFLSRVGVQMTVEQLQVVTRKATVLNHTNEAWCKGMRDFLLTLLPNPTASEDVNTKVGTYTSTKKKREVKRRPRHTHRDYIEKLNGTLPNNSNSPPERTTGAEQIIGIPNHKYPGNADADTETYLSTAGT